MATKTYNDNPRQATVLNPTDLLGIQQGTTLADMKKVTYEDLMHPVQAQLDQDASSIANLNTFTSVKNIDEEALSEEELLSIMEGLSEGIYKVHTLRYGNEFLLKSTLTITDPVTKEESKALRYGRLVANGTSYEWNQGLNEWVMSAGGGGGGGGGGSNLLRLNTYPANTPLTLISVVGNPLELSIQYNNGSVTVGNLSVYRNDIFIKQMQINLGITTLELGHFIQAGTNKVDIKVTDSLGNSATITYLVTGVTLSIGSTFNDASILTPSGSLGFTIVGAGSKTVIGVLDGVTTEFATQTSYNTYNYADLSHGEHILTLQAKSLFDGGVELLSNTIKFSLLVAEAENEATILSSKFDSFEVRQGTTVAVDYVAYVPAAETASVSLYVDDVLKNTTTVDRSRHYFNVGGLEIGERVIKLVCEEASLSFTVTVVELDIDFTPVEDASLKLAMFTAGRSNEDSDKEVWANEYGESTTTFLQNFNWQTNGWVDSGLVFNGQAKAIIVHKPFEMEVGNTGKTIELEFETVKDLGTGVPFIDCMDNDRGIQVLSDRVYLKASNKTVATLITEGVRIKVSFVIDKVNRKIETYIDGVLSGIDRIDAYSAFKHTSAQNININLSEVGGTVYGIRVYDRALTAAEVLQNFLYDLQDIDMKLSNYVASDILDVYNEIDIVKLKALMPVLTIKTRVTDPQGNAMPITSGYRPKVELVFENPKDTTKDFAITDVTLRTQGTSTLIYPVKNYRLTLPTGEFEYAIDVTQCRPTKILNIKTDYMESSLSTNVGVCRLINDELYDTLLPIQDVDSLVRNCTYGYPIAVFNEHLGVSKFWGVYNLNTDKSDPQTFGHYAGSGFPDSRKFEILDNVSNSAGAFIRKPGMTDTEWFNETKSMFESNYPTDNTTLDNYQPLLEMVEFVSNSVNVDMDDPIAVEEYKDEFKKRIDLEYAIKYLLLCYMVGSIDSFGKDLMLNTWGEIDGFYKWFITFYDLDTCIGIDNSGHMLNEHGEPIYDYDIELSDDGAFAQAKSRIWDTVLAFFGPEVAAFYAKLRTDGVFTMENIFDKHLVGYQISQISKALYNENAEFKYVETEGSEQWAYVLKGDRYHQLQRWLSNRINFLDSKYGYNEDIKKISARVEADDASLIDLTLTPDVHLWLSAHVGNTAQVLGRAEGRTRAGVPATITSNLPIGSGFEYTMITINNAHHLVDLGDIGNNPNYTLTDLQLGHASKLRALDLGKDAPDSSLREVVMGDNAELVTLDLHNNSELSGLLNLTACTKLKTLDLRGTKYTSVSFPVGGVLEECHLPNTIKTLDIRNQSYLTQENFTIEEGSHIEVLRVENASVDVFKLIDGLTVDAHVRILGVEASLYNNTMLDILMTNLTGRGGIAVDGTLTNAFVFYAKFKVLKNQMFDEQQYIDLFPNAELIFIHISSEFTIQETKNTRGTYTITGYTGTEVLVELPITEYNGELSTEKIYGEYSTWAMIDEIATSAFSSGYDAIHIPANYAVIQSNAFTNAYKGIITTDAETIPSEWLVDAQEVFTAQEKAFIVEEYTVLRNSSGVALIKYHGSDIEHEVLKSIEVEAEMLVPYYLARNYFEHATGTVTELHIPENITHIGKGFTSHIPETSIVWATGTEALENWDIDWNVDERQVCFNVSNEKVDYILDLNGVLSTYNGYGITEARRKELAFGYGIYPNDEFSDEIVLPFVRKQETELYLGMILAKATYALVGEAYKVVGYDASRMDEGDRTVRIVVNATEQGLPVETMQENAIGKNTVETNAGAIKEVIFKTNVAFKPIGLPVYAFANLPELDYVYLPSEIEVIPAYSFYNTSMSDFNFTNITLIGDHAFDSCLMSYLELKDTITFIGDSAFLNNTVSQIIAYGDSTVVGDNMLSTTLPDNFKDVYTVGESGIYTGSQDGVWVQAQKLPTAPEYFTFVDGVVTDYDIAGGLEPVIPRKIYGETVTEISQNAFRDKGITSVFIPLGIEKIGNYAFAGNSLSSVLIPNSVTYIGANAFKGLAELDITLGTGQDSYVTQYEEDGRVVVVGHISTMTGTSYTIANDVKRIETGAFDGAPFETLNILSNTALILEAEAFINCDVLTTIMSFVPKENMSIGLELISSGDNSFKTAFENEPDFNGKGEYKLEAGTWIWKYEIWEKEWDLANFELIDYEYIEVRMVGSNSEYETFINPIYINKILTNDPIVNIPGKVGDRQVFYNSKASYGGPGVLAGAKYATLKELDIQSTAIPFEAAVSYPTGLRGTRHRWYYTFAQLSNLEKISAIPFGVTELSGAFYQCKKLNYTHEIPQGVLTMNYTFSDCYKQTVSHVLPPTVKELLNTYAGTKITVPPVIPSGVTRMSNMFYNCEMLTYGPDIPSSVYEALKCFSGCEKMVTVGSLSPNINQMQQMFYGCKELVSVGDLSPINTTLEYTFYNCEKLTSVGNLGNNVTMMGGTFSGCKSLTNVPTIPATVTIMASTFQGCESLVDAPSIPDNVTDLTSVFNKCSNLITSPVLPEGVTNLTYAFSDCISLLSAPIIPSTVTAMHNTFAGCVLLTEGPTLPDSVLTLEGTFRNCTALTASPVIPSNVTIMQSTFVNCTALTVPPVLPDSLIDMYLIFGGCINLETAPNIPPNVTNMTACFQRCAKIETAPAIPEGVLYLNDAFYECTRITTSPVLPESAVTIDNMYSGCSALIEAPVIPNNVTSMKGMFYGCSSLVTAPIIPVRVDSLYAVFANCLSLEGDIIVLSNKVAISGGMTYLFNNTQLPKTLYIPYSGFSATHDTKLAAENAGYLGGPMKEGVTVKKGFDINDFNVNYDYETVELKGEQGNVISTVTNPIYIESIKPGVNSVSIPATFDGRQIIYNVFSEYGTCSALVENVKTTLTNIEISPLAIPFFKDSGDAISMSGKINKWENLFNGCTNLITGPTAIPESITTMSSAFYSCKNLIVAPVIIPNSVKNMQTSFRYCTNMTTPPLTIGNSVTTMRYCFEDCQSITFMPVLGSSVTTFNYAFSGCLSLTAITPLPDSIKSMDYAFYNCTLLPTIPNLPANLTTAPFAFGACELITSTPPIPSKATDISYMFHGCTNLTGDLVLLPTTPPGFTSTLKNVADTASIVFYVPVGCLAAYQAADDWVEYAAQMVEGLPE